MAYGEVREPEKSTTDKIETGKQKDLDTWTSEKRILRLLSQTAVITEVQYNSVESKTYISVGSVNAEGPNERQSDRF